MKANELMIGDWVYMRLKSKEKYYTERVFSISDAEFLDYIPIPLTNDILNKNGFEEFGAFGMCRLKVESEQKTICANGTYIEVYSNSNHESMLRLHSTHFTVHELQHALRLCGLNELADNFKVS